MEEKFDIDFLEDAIDFMNSLESKVQRKIYYNLKKSIFDFLLSGIKQIKRKPLL